MNPTKTFTMAVLSDMHFAERDDLEHPERAVARGLELLARAAQHVNQTIAPDVTLILGDLLDEPNRPAALGYLKQMHDVVSRLESDVIAIPGNHDPEPELFYSVFTRPEEYVDVKGVRCLSFIDPEQPEYNARRMPPDLERMAQARTGFDGPIVSIQHVPLFPPGAAECPFNYVNAPEVIGLMHEYDIGFAVSGHYHPGLDLIQRDGLSFIVNPALCEYPFAFLEVMLDPAVLLTEGLCVRRHTLGWGD
ncbi:MAG TPA: hypothetical protein HPP77_01470 [Candidatus Hydrogenedentes bacterium]|nr:hypothetical protein [Candidatus Hydrogenedentota bacterium]HIJ73838.1 hypothetical protein [Candidatus Hydrogenedentota bacterium]